MRFCLADDDRRPRLAGLVRLDVFATRTIGKGKKAKPQGVAWQGWNDDPVLETACARLAGSGSFYWFGAVRALAAARAMMTADTSIHQIKLESVSGVEIGRVYR